MTTRPKVFTVYLLMACRFGAAASRAAIRSSGAKAVHREKS
ncbi:hypothetical protein [Saccharopolyspora mangrovi]|uniref:Uncharacterized protein n=1 Tax=Saccharopolyspora mangrovi TaxID=3082379 RepID=A0ABU6A7B4_9PSEU|nr:hypothetical protein [Saccharopolyspora sp. S2-29]MEB3367352.1 hypothetical protein [Saccharopolyspora sp. S2-29]